MHLRVLECVPFSLAELVVKPAYAKDGSAENPFIVDAGCQMSLHFLDRFGEPVVTDT